MLRVEISEAAAPATRAAEKVRLFIIMISVPSRINANCLVGWRRAAPDA
jgi:hypothetical protein